MENLTNLKAILHSKRANIYYLEKCRVMQKDGRVLYLTEDEKNKKYWNIPIANTTVIMLGIGTSITQAAVRMLINAGVMIGFCGNEGTPLLAGCEIEWMSPQSEYRPTEYMQGWMSFWFNDVKRLNAAKKIQLSRMEFIKNVWAKDRDLQAEGFYIDDIDINSAFKKFKKNISKAENVNTLLVVESHLAKDLYRISADRVQYNNFVRKHQSKDKANIFLNHGNYLAYGLSATALWVLGISHSFALMHGKTRRGALVFDIADLVKDALVLPWSFICAKEGMNNREFRQQCLQTFTQHKALEYMFNSIKDIALQGNLI